MYEVIKVPIDNYVAVIGDIINSKKIEERAAVQSKLNTVLDSVNAEYREELASRFLITLGDEFQGILKSASLIVFIIDKIEREMFPIKIRFGIGIGEINTVINPSAPLGADGPAFHLARKGIEELKALEKKNMAEKVNVRVEIHDNRAVSEIVNTVFSLLSIIKQSWTPRQMEIINDYLKPNRTQELTANELGVNQSTVQKSLTAANYYTYINALKSLSRTFACIGESYDV